MNLDRYVLFAGYNVWANERLYNAAEKLSDQEYRADRGVFFKSIHGTLNHLLVADRIWMKRFTGQGEAPNKLDVILFDGSRHAARRARPRGCPHQRLCCRARRRQSSPPISATRPSSIRRRSRSRSRLRSTMSSTTRPITAGRRTRCCTGLRGRDFAPSFDMILYQRETGAGGVVGGRSPAPASKSLKNHCLCGGYGHAVAGVLLHNCPSQHPAL